MCVRVCVRERKRVSALERVRVCVRESVCLHESVYVCMRESVCVCMSLLCISSMSVNKKFKNACMYASCKNSMMRVSACCGIKIAALNKK
jgi:hypothetical protein